MIQLCALILLTLFSSLYAAPIPKKPAGWDKWTFSEKIAWRGKNLDPRINYRVLVDKLLVKEVMKEHVKVAKTLFATDDPSTISTLNLPTSYMMKANNACGRGLLIKDGFIVARHKGDVDFIPIEATDEVLRSYAAAWLSSCYMPNTEKQYKMVKPMVLFEEVLEELTMDLEFFCFNGKVPLILIKFREGYKNPPPSRSLYDSDWNLIKGQNVGPYTFINTRIDPPKGFQELLALTQELTRDMDHVRVDYFLVGEEFYFGEFTFTTWGGNAQTFLPSYFNKLLGEHWVYPKKRSSCNIKGF